VKNSSVAYADYFFGDPHHTLPTKVMYCCASLFRYFRGARKILPKKVKNSFVAYADYFFGAHYILTHESDAQLCRPIDLSAHYWYHFSLL